MIDRFFKLIETRRATLLAILGALILALTGDNAAAHLTNDLGFPADVSIRVVGWAKFWVTVMAGAGLSFVPKKGS